MRFGLIGRSYRHKSPAVASERSVNLYPVKVLGGGVTEQVLDTTPGFAIFCTLPTGPVRAVFFQNDRCFAVGGPTLYEVYRTGTYVERGFVGTDDLPATITSNGATNGSGGHQLFIVSAGDGFILDLNDHTFAKVLDGQATFGGYLDGFFVALDVPASTVRLSSLMNGLVWPGASVAQRSMAADAWQGMAISHRELWLLGGQTLECWYNAGLDLFPLTPRPGADSDVGIAAPASVVSTGNTVLWLGGDAEGHGIVYMSVGYQPQAITEPGHPIQRYATIADAVGWSYQDQGHTFYVLSFPTERATWVYDLTEGAWHERGWWNVDRQRFDAYRAQSHAFAWGAHLVGDRESGDLYEMSIDFPLDVDGAVIRRVRETPHVTNEHQWLFHTALEVALEPGIGTVTTGTLTGRLVGATGFAGPTPPVVPVTENPAVVVQWSDDGGFTWSDERLEHVGRRGDRLARCVFRQLGRSRDRVYRVILTDPVPWRIIDGYAIVAGSGVS